ncbi:hypothetical protein DOTSEDRAFT_79114 [Dothistroma septosporum NZE10]|uniref:Uncharacterized protein n=1 Tax=Dothistroma septosporum (strain NZE10 / CBS 128990) TaxID=675120 RepID=N1PRE5_DOTSN|nr:hypothetical protein DOTSEDRAFT_79114 [Dothistroma septosporum NZE10]
MATKPPSLKSPVELLVLIEDFLTETERSDVLQQWQIEYKCSEGECVPKDHYPNSRLNEWRRMICLDTARSDVLTDEDVDERLNDFIADHTSYIDNHWSRYDSWEDRIGCGPTSIIRQQQDLMMKHFGLDLWLCKTRINGISANKCSAARDTLAYLKLPHGAPHSRSFNLSPDEQGNSCFYFTGSSSIAVAGDLALPQDGQAKTERCLRILGLRPHGCDTEAGSMLSARVIAKAEDERPYTAWPQLTVLTEIRAGTDD